MAGRLRGVAEWVGIVPNDRYVYADDPDAELTEDFSRSGAHRDDVASELDRRRSIEPSRQMAADPSRIVTVHPRTYNEARTIGEHFREGVPVIMNLTEMDDTDAKRLVDFAAGLSFGLRGTIERVTSKVFLLSPQNVNVTAEDKERIAGGFYNQS